uniref:Uncharacterized protein n=1 Tax=Alexandrium catenella TaxID=2925 RepID=A0A7S1S645_ALECA|mmetsp:Transcript_87752/g.232966  ORF Transcript_87752/g.232966 Transcript_87752/m.232966 type:complete len:407 (+) Transcript_87752:119-1339(+)
MEETRALLDALMGPNRNAKVAAPGGKPDFADRSVCKFFLVGFCPHDWFTTAKRQLRPCNKIHSEMMREQFERHSEVGRYRAEYEEDFLNYLEVVARDCDAYISRERPKCRSRGVGGKVVRMPPDAKKRCEEMEARYAELIKSSEGMAESSLAMSQMQMKQAIALNEEIDDLKQKYTTEFPGEDLCEICGVKYLCGGGANQWHDEEDHKRGKTHDGFKQIRAKIVELRGKRKHWEKWREDVERARARDREEEREFEKRERQKERERREREKERERELERVRELEERRKRERERERERSRGRSEDRGRRREADKKGDRRKDGDRGKEKDRDQERSRSRGQPDAPEESEDLAALWAHLGTFTPEARAAAVKALKQDTKDRLEEWLVARISAQGGGASDSDDSDSDSGDS